VQALTIARREMRAYFNSPVAYIVVTVFLVLAGYLFFTQALLGGQAEMRPLFDISPLLFVFFAPAITMRLLAEERRVGTFQLLITLPLRDRDVVIGKFLGALGLLATAIALTLFYPLTLSRLGDLDGGAVIGGYLGLLLMGAAYLGIGLMASAWTRNQIVAFIVAFAICFALFLMGRLGQLVPPALAPVIEYLSLTTHFENIARGVIDTRDVLYYASLIGACLFVAVQSLASRQWRG
jgi:gliding motility-associated transport system permease protein